MTNPASGEFACMTPQIVWGPGAAASVGSHVARVGGNKALVLSGRKVGASNWFQALREQMGAACADVYDGIEPHTPVESLAGAIARAHELRVDAVVAVGGGAVMDAGKLVALALAEGEDFDRHRVRWTPERHLQIPTLAAPKLPVIAIPTTLAAAEVVGAAAYVDGAERFVIVDPGILPKVVIYDPVLAATTPPPLFLGTGINAVAHCIEAIYSVKAQPFSTSLALGALETLVRGLRRTFLQPGDLAGLQDAQVGAAMSGVAYTGTWLGIAHSLCQALGARHRTAQGALHAVILPHAMRYNLPATPDQQEAMSLAISRGMGTPDHAPTGGDASAAVARLTQALQLPQRLRDLGIPRAELDAAAEDAFRVWHTHFNPRHVAAPGELRDVLAAAW